MNTAAWRVFDETGPTVWRRRVGDGTELEVQAFRSLSRWTHARVDEDRYYGAEDVIAEHWLECSAGDAMRAADGHAQGATS